MKALHQLNQLVDTYSLTDKMPVLFLGHGSPMNAIEENQFTNGFHQVAATLQKPKAIIVISAHWYTQGTFVTAMQKPRTIHDFIGFPEALFNVNYPANGSPGLAMETKNILNPVKVELDEEWGLDHGTWSVLKHLYPKADIPVIQLSIDYTKETAYHFELAKKLSALRDKGVLIIGSGNIIHNLRLVDWKNFDKENYGFDWAIETKATINQLILDQNIQPLINFKNASKAFQLAIPTPDHYLPLIYTLGLQQKEDSILLFNDKLVGGSLSMTSLKIG
ncbi:MAG: 4,5-DOPA dioxygenase extradiol [Bacteroidetes bacterium]|jgi:4,5-DOPA dioxygenase extradiol|nr:4,5-DOPA dioxygenase extradiol [Bacteroidota bacterium]